MTETRTIIADHVTANPGVHFSQLVRSLDLAPGQVQYHLRRLLSADEVTAEDLYGKTHYYPPEYDRWERAAIALFRRETARDVLGHLMAHGPSRPAAVADDLGVARSTLEWHVGHLVERDVVEKRREPGNRVILALARPETTAELLSTVTPSLPERLVDRFTRLVDNLLEE